MESFSCSDRILQLQGYRLTTAEIIYGLPDHPKLLQTFIWQDLDLPPHFPRLQAFLNFWHETLEAPLLTVNVAYTNKTNPILPRVAKEEFTLH